MAGMEECNAAVGPSLPTLPNEILLRIVKASLLTDDHDADTEQRIEIPGLVAAFPPQLAVARTNTTINKSILAWTYNTYNFCFTSQRDEMYPNSRKPQYAGEALLAWLQKIGAGNRRSVRKLALRLTAPELLFLFATPESRVLLKQPRDLHVWAECQTVLKSLELNQLNITVLYGLDESLYQEAMVKHLEADLRWVIKAVLDTMAHSPRCHVKFATEELGAFTKADVEAIRSLTWSMLHSDTFGYHRSLKLAYRNERATTWASPDDEVIRPYQIPVVSSCRRHNGEMDDLLPSLRDLNLLWRLETPPKQCAVSMGWKLHSPTWSGVA